MRPYHRVLILISCVWAFSASGQRVHGHLPLESFSSAQGLANDSVTTISTDSRGYLWFGTLDGVSRFDGDRFVNYTTDDGIPNRMVWSIVEDKNGSIWVGTFEGAAEMKPSATRGLNLFNSYTVRKGEAAQAALVFVDRRGTVWTSCGADLCFHRDGRLVVDPAFRRAGGWAPRAMVESPRGDLYVGGDQGLMHRRPDGRWHRQIVQPHRGADIIHGLYLDPGGRVWIGNGFGLIIYAPGDERDARPLADRAGAPRIPGMTLQLPKPGEAVAVTVPSQSPVIRCQTPHRARDGAVWQPCVDGLLRIADGRIDVYDANDGLPPVQITAVAEDPAGDLWIGTRGAGAFRVARAGATSYTRAHGLAHQRIMSLISLDDGTVCVTNPEGLSCFRGDEIHHGLPWPRETKFRGWGWNQIVIHDDDGTWWFTTGQGVVHWPKVDRIEDLGRVVPLAIYTTRDGLGADEVFRLWKDSRGTIWASTFAVDKPLSKFDRATRRFQSFGVEAGIPLAAPTAFAEDRAGNVWIGFYEGGLARSIGNDRFERMTRNIPPGFVRDLKIDSKGGLWIGAMGGVARIADPTVESARLAIRRYSRKDGLASDSGYCFVEMNDGRIAIGSQRGLDILDPATGSVMHMTSREGLASNEVSVATLDRSGALWLGTVNGLSRLSTIPKPQPKVPRQPRIHTITIDGIPTAVPELGTTTISGVRIQYPRHSMAVGFTAPDYDAADPLRFEYRFLGNGPWTDLGHQRAIAFDRLRAGSGTLEIRATAGGRTSPPAQVSFEVIPAIWKRTWFLVLVAAILLVVALALHRYRVAHLVALERVRTRVATDLHDDLGSSLSRISILSEAAKRKAADPEPILDEIADSARGLVDALGDSIWSIDPMRDDVRSLVQRARHFAAAVFEAQSIAIDVRVPPDIATMHLGPEQRREVYLILKEALNNAAKHAQAQHVAILANAEDRSLRIAVKDDGKGFASNNGASRDNGGRGVPSMLDRARRVGGKLEIASMPGEGTTVTVALPVQGRAAGHGAASQRAV